MLKLLFLPGALFLLVILFRVVIPQISTAPWKRLLDNARYHRHRKEMDKSDKLLEKAVLKYPERPEVYLEYFLNNSDSADLKKRFDIISAGYKKTGDPVLRFFIGSTYLEHGLFSDADRHLDNPGCREYMLSKGITLLPELYYEQGDYDKAETEFEDFYRRLYNDDRDFNELLSEMSPQDLIMIALIKKAAGEDYKTIMDFAPKTSVHSNMSWRDFLSVLHGKLNSLDPATIGIQGDAGEFNRKRREYFQSRIQLIESYL